MLNCCLVGTDQVNVLVARPSASRGDLFMAACGCCQCLKVFLKLLTHLITPGASLSDYIAFQLADARFLMGQSIDTNAVSQLDEDDLCSLLLVMLAAALLRLKLGISGKFCSQSCRHLMEPVGFASHSAC